MSRGQPAAAPASKTLGAVIREKDEELALFLEMRRRERERRDRRGAAAVDGSVLAGSDAVPVKDAKVPARKGAAEDFLNGDGEKNDYDWLLTPPGTPLFPALEAQLRRSPTSNAGTPKTRPAALNSKLANNPESLSRTSITSRTASTANMNLVTPRPSSSGGPPPASSRPATPTVRLAATKACRPSTPTSRPTIPSKAAPPQRSATPSRTAAAVPSARSSTPTRSSAPAKLPSGTTVTRSSTPISRPSVPADIKTASFRAANPPRRASAPSTQSFVATKMEHSTSVTKSVPTVGKCSLPSQGSTPISKPKPWKPSEMPGFSLDAPPNLRTSAPGRPTSAPRGRPGAPSSRSSSVEPGPAARPRRQSCSPSRGRSCLTSTVPTGSSVPASRRSERNASDSVNPVQIGNKMVERVVNMRRLGPPKQHNQILNQNSPSGRPSLSPDSAGFGRTISKKSIDMALRHMDIRRSIPNNLRPLMTSIPASSVYSTRSGSARNRQVSVTDSPLATSSNCSSELSVNNSTTYFHGGGLEDDLNSERSIRVSHS